MTTETERVTDWATDYDIFDPDYVRNPVPVWEDLRERCPVAHSERWGGSWMPTRYADLFAIAQDFQHFSSRQVLVVPIGPQTLEEEAEAESDPFYGVAAPPITSDPPEHTWSRRLILSPFSIKSVERYEEETRELCRSLIDAFIDRGRADAAVDYAQQIPPRIIASMLGIPKEMSDQFTQWTRELLEFGLTNPEMGANARQQTLAFLWQRIQERRRQPADDLISYLVQAQVDGQPVSDQHILGTCFLLLLAGIDTTWNSIGSALWHLAQHPEDCARLAAEPELMRTAIEEFLRAYAPVTMARVVAEDVEYNDCKMAEGHKVLMNFPAANRDPEKFPDPDKVIIDRAVNPHIAFGVGIHRCAGSNLARMEMRVSIEEWLKRIPSFRLEDPDAVTWAGGQVRGPRSMPVLFP